MEQRLIDATDFDSKLFSNGFFGGLACTFGNAPRKRKFTIGEFRGMLAKSPTVDPVHAAGACYCRECKFLTDKHYEDTGEEPYTKHSCGIFKKSMQLTDFCSYGERRESNE